MTESNTNLEELKDITENYKTFLEDIRKSENCINQVLEEFEMEPDFIRLKNNLNNPYSDTSELIKTYLMKSQELKSMFQLVIQEDCVASFQALLKALEEYHNK